MPHTETARVELSCPAKVNLALSVGRARPSDGLHPIASWMAAVHFADHLVIERSDDGASGFEIAFDESPEAPGSDAQVDWPLERDLGYRAHALAQQHLGRDLPVRVSVTKRIPPGAGLGGGSSNAAAMLVGLDRLFDLSLDETTLAGLASRLGSDVGFLVGALRGSPSAIVTGLGESIAPAPRDGSIPLVLIFPPFGCPTGPVYQAFDRLRDDEAPVQPALSRVTELASLSPLPQDAPFNDLADSACAVEPRLRDAWNRATDALGLPVHLTGSGSTLFVIAPTALTANVLARKVTAVTGLAAVATRTV